MKRFFVFFVIIFFLANFYTQNNAVNISENEEKHEMSKEDAEYVRHHAVTTERKIPEWLHAMQHSGIVTVGSLPFTMLSVNLGMGVKSWVDSGFDPKGFPNPLDPSPDTSGFDKDEILRRLTIATGISLGIGVTDLVIGLIKTYKKKKDTTDIVKIKNITITPIVHDFPQDVDERKKPDDEENEEGDN